MLKHTCGKGIPLLLAFLTSPSMACFALDEFESAEAAFKKGQELDPNDPTFNTWLRKCKAEMESEQTETPATSAPSTAPPAVPAPTPSNQPQTISNPTPRIR